MKKKHSIHHNQNCKLFEIRNKNKKQQQKQQVNYEIVLTEKKKSQIKKGIQKICSLDFVNAILVRIYLLGNAPAVNQSVFARQRFSKQF